MKLVENKKILFNFSILVKVQKKKIQRIKNTIITILAVVLSSFKYLEIC